MRRHASWKSFALALALATFALAQGASRVPGQGFVNYEVGQTRPIAISADGLRLFTVDTPRDRLLIWSLANALEPRLIDEIPVGARPVSVRARTADELWVVNRLGDSVSVVSLKGRRVVAQLSVGDEACDVVFARGSSDRELALVSVALEHRLVVFDAQSRTRLASLDLFGERPRSLAVSADGRYVYCVVHRSGNGTTIIPSTDPMRPPPPRQGAGLPIPPKAGTIVDASDPFWGPRLGVKLPDEDLYQIDARTLRVSRVWRGLGTLHFALTVDARGRVWVAGTEARNRVRHEPALRGHVVDHRVVRVDPSDASGKASIFDLNPQIDYSKLPNPAGLATALAQVHDVAAARDGTLWVAAFGTDRIAQLDGDGRVLSRIEVGTTPGARVAPREKRGPRGLVLHPSRDLCYTYARLSHSLVVIDTASKRRLQEFALPEDPLPREERVGRKFLYDAKLSGNGTASCSSCHTDGSIDGLAWDLGDPNGKQFRIRTAEGALEPLHPMKGPLATQTLKGIRNAAPFHWRGDRRRFSDFNPTFDALLGGKELAQADMEAFERFVFGMRHMPNPHQLRDRSFAREPKGESAFDGKLFFDSKVVFRSFRCVSCHARPDGSTDLIFHHTTLGTTQSLKVPQLRTTYRRMGRSRRRGPMERAAGFGLAHDGSDDTAFDFLGRPVFLAVAKDARIKRMLERFLLAFDTGTAPAVGWARLVEAGTVASPDTQAYWSLMEAQAKLRNIDFAARGSLAGRRVGLLWIPELRRFEENRNGRAWSRAELEDALATGRAQLLFDGLAPGSGERFALDENRNGIRDAHELPRSYGHASPATSTLTLDSAGALQARAKGMRLVVRNARGPVLMLLSTRAAQLRVFGVEVLVDPAAPHVALWRSADARGVATLDVGIPAAVAGSGREIFAQAFDLAPQSSRVLAASAGLVLRLR